MEGGGGNLRQKEKKKHLGHKLTNFGCFKQEIQLPDFSLMLSSLSLEIQLKDPMPITFSSPRTQSEEVHFFEIK